MTTTAQAESSSAHANGSSTIVAPITPPGRGGVSILRVSGPDAFAAAARHFHAIPKPRNFCTSVFRSHQGEVLDDGLLLCFQNPHSFTGEDTWEFQGHGSPILMDRLLRELLLHPTLRLARPGEFSERAFLNGKLDLTQAESIADLIAAHSEAESRAAMKGLQGGLSARVEARATDVLGLRTWVEAHLDFIEDEVSAEQVPDLKRRVRKLQLDLEMLLGHARRSQRLTQGRSIAIVGLPNSGKSSLFNRLLGQERAITSTQAGTTRDTISELLIVHGAELILTDTAGIRATQDPIEQEGVRRSKTAVDHAELILWVQDGAQLTAEEPESWPEKLRTVSLSLFGLDGPQVPYFLILNKQDLFPADDKAPLTSLGFEPNWPGGPCLGCVPASAKTGAGLAELTHRIGEHLARHTNRESESFDFLARTRHLERLERAHDELFCALQRLEDEGMMALDRVGDHLLAAQTNLGQITGKLYNSELLDSIFSTFCLGK